MTFPQTEEYSAWANTPLNKDCPIFELDTASVIIRYKLSNSTGRVSLSIFPTDQKTEVQERREKDSSHPFINDGDIFSGPGDSDEDNLVQLHIRGKAFSNGFIAGKSYCLSECSQELVLHRQQMTQDSDRTTIRTILRYKDQIECQHDLVAFNNSSGVFVQTTARNISKDAITIEHLSSFVLSKISPFLVDEMTHQLDLLRIRSSWSAEGRVESIPIEKLQMERSWAGFSICTDKISQTGSMPVRGYFPFIGIHDKVNHTYWAAQTYWHGSWQMEAQRRSDPFTLTGGMADYDTGHWHKCLKSGDSYTAPTAWLCTTTGGLNALFAAVREQYQYTSRKEPESESSFPIIFNEWCSSWGNPQHEDIINKGKIVKDIGADVFMIDDGWAEKPGKGFQFNGDWNLDRNRFPNGMDATVKELQKLGIRTGIWYEPEVCTDGTEAFKKTEHHLKRNGFPIQTGTRHFWDFRDPYTKEYLRKKLLNFLKSSGITYLKIDYNDSVGIGVDPANKEDGIGEGLTEHLKAVKEFYEEVRDEIPELVFENCSSGGHRIEPGMAAFSSMCSFSDAHESVEIPIIAANIQRLIPSSANQVWAVLRKEDSLQRINYSLASTFMGRMCISGDIDSLDPEIIQQIKNLIKLYKKVTPVIREGKSVLYRTIGDSYRKPEGSQCLLYESASTNDKSVLAIFHAFENEKHPTLNISLAKGNWAIEECIFEGNTAINGNQFTISFDRSFSGGVALLKPSPASNE